MGEQLDPTPWRLVTEAVAQLRTEVTSLVRELNRDLTARLDKLVTTDVHVAETKRLDERINELAKDLVEERTERVAGIATVLGSVDRLAEGLKAEAESRTTADTRETERVLSKVASEQDARKKDRQWLIFTMVSLAGVLITLLAVYHK